jgi:hypothetical protein
MVSNYMKISGEPATNAVCSWVDWMMAVDWWSTTHGEVEDVTAEDVECVGVEEVGGPECNLVCYDLEIGSLLEGGH